MRGTRRWFCILAVLWLGLGQWGCSAEPFVPRTAGEACGARSECADSLCYESQCLDPARDDDSDGLTNAIEGLLGTNPLSSDTDGDEVSDKVEVGTDIANPLDEDGDGNIDAVESNLVDTDGVPDCLVDQKDNPDQPPPEDKEALYNIGCCCGAPCDELGVSVNNEETECVFAEVDGVTMEVLACVTDEPDSDGDGIKDSCDWCPQYKPGEDDPDGDGICSEIDNCPEVANADQVDADQDGRGDVCDACPDGVVLAQPGPDGKVSKPEQGADPNDPDGDGVLDCYPWGCEAGAGPDCVIDNCPGVYNPDQLDSDGDADQEVHAGDACDTDVDNDGTPNDVDEDDDGDDVIDALDNCPNTPNTDQSDSDEDLANGSCDAGDASEGCLGDGLGDVCDPCPGLALNDKDGDGFVDCDADGDGDDDDPCPDEPEFFDGDNLPVCLDNCPEVSNPSQIDSDGDDVGDACDPEPFYTDSDLDGIPNGEDACPEGATGWLAADGQDIDMDGCRDDEDTDTDGDGILNVDDSCEAGETGWTSDAVNDNDGDGCKDDGATPGAPGEDTDDDNDGLADNDDECPKGDLEWDQVDSQQDHDQDGCQDAGEDTDDDNDGLVDGDDECQKGEVGWDQESSSEDKDQDGCQDATEDNDDDNDGLVDVEDSCPQGEVGWDQSGDQDHDQDGCQDATEDGDDDGDGVEDEADACPQGATNWVSDPESDHDGDGCKDDVEGECPAGFTGSGCTVNIDDCADSPCLNGGTCTDGVASFTCACAAGFEGETCDVNIDECADSPCLNGGTCTDGVASFTCECAVGFEGETCDVDIDDCADSPCLNGGSCTDGVASFTCACADGYTGATCEVDIDDCADDPCLNGGSCTDGVAGFTCACAEGYEGETCEVDIDECADSPCLNGGTCTDLVAGFTCACADGYTGQTCEVDIDECAEAPCLNGGTCTDGVASFSCACAAGYEGETCAVDIDECADADCGAGTCVDGVNGYTCACDAGFEGAACETNIDDCAGSPCLNGGTCTDGVDGFSCACAQGFYGETCAFDTDDCAASPCQNGGTCTDGVDGFVCTCAPGFYGEICEHQNLPPVVYAGADQDVDELATVDLVGTADDDDGAVVSVAWIQLSGPELTLTGSDSLHASFSAPATDSPLVLVFQLSVTDDLDATSIDFTVVTVHGLNALPTVDAGEDATINELASTTLDGNAEDPDGSIATVTWTQLAGPEAIIDDPSLLQSAFTAPDVETEELLIFELEVEDNEGGVASDTVAFVVNPVVDGNVPPQVYAGPNFTQSANTSTELSGEASDFDGSVVRTEWVQVSGAPVSLVDANTLAPSFVTPALTCAEILLFELEVEDDLGAITTDQVSVTVSADLAHITALGTLFDFELDDNGFSTATEAWVRGQPTTGPGQAYSGANVWATNLSGFYGPSLNDALCLPPVNRAGEARVTVSARVWHDAYDANYDALRIEVLDTSLGWVPMDEVEPAYQSVDQGLPGWRTLKYGTNYRFITAEVPAAAGQTPHVRFVFKSNHANNGAYGAYIDDVRVDSEATDPDGDGLLGVADEFLTYGTDPHLADTDQDGFDDGLEITEGSDPLSPASYPEAPTLVPGMLLDFDGDDGDLMPMTEVGGLSVTGGLWEHGIPTSGPNRAHSGSKVWATRLSSGYANFDVGYLHLPLIDLTTATDPTLSFFFWVDAPSGDGLSLEIYNEDSMQWDPMLPSFPDYNGIDGHGKSCWGTNRELDYYGLVIVSLAEYAGREIRVRLAFRANNITKGYGAYIDDLALHDEEGSDPDGDGLFGVADEFLVYGTDPFNADTDQDGFDDGQEIVEGSDPLSPASYPGAPTLVPGVLLDFDGDDGDLMPLTEVGALSIPDDLWEHGVPSTGPNVAHSGTKVWATNLSGNFGAYEVAYLRLPLIDLTTATDPTLSFFFWVDSYGADGLSLEIYNDVSATWETVPPDFPAYNATDGLGKSCWGDYHRLDLYGFAAFSLESYVGKAVKARLAFRSNCCNVAPGAYIDDLALYEEGSDPDEDGLLGVIDEFLTHGTDPFVADTDQDDHLDGQEVNAGTDPLSPASFDGGVALTPGMLLDFEVDDGGLASMTEMGGLSMPDDLWEHGLPSTGPSVAHSGSKVWATNLSGNFGAYEVAYLRLPLIDLTTATDPTLSFFFWVDSYGADGLSLEIYNDVSATWETVPPDFPAYNATDGLGKSCWGDYHRLDIYGFAAFSLEAYVDQSVKVRLAFRSNCCNVAPGAYIDDLALYEEGSDPDEDGLLGVIDEFLTHGTDPFVADTDQDDHLDGQEVNAGTDPLSPASFDGGVALTPGMLLDFEVDDGGLASMTEMGGLSMPDDLWEHGLPSTGPSVAHSGSKVWATNLSGNFGAYEVA
ncbi:MAG: PKD domain-containing protein, partial [Myxococcota bacterium]